MPPNDDVAEAADETSRLVDATPRLDASSAPTDTENRLLLEGPTINVKADDVKMLLLMKRVLLIIELISVDRAFS